LPNCSIISQDDFFKPESEVDIDDRGFLQYDVLDALYMEKMVSNIHSWMTNPVLTGNSESMHDSLNGTEVHILIVEGFLLYNYEPLNEVWDIKYFLTIPYEECKKRRSSRVYKPADPPGYFDGHVWPMYLEHRREMEEKTSDIVYLDGTKSQEELFSQVHNDIVQDLKKTKVSGSSGNWFVGRQ
uniref:Nicotinamide riboside kinase 1 n=1 Tax=Sphenodon punctatus TaxID=8508 RepID=A0A8D0H784_SPHPU